MNDDRLELLLFYLGETQRFGINVLKVKEVIPTPPLTELPDSHPAIRGVAHLRGQTLPVIKLSQAIGRYGADDANGSVIITEMNRSTQGLEVSRIDRIVMKEWDDVLPPPAGSGRSAYMSGVTRVDDELIQILDVERVLAEVLGVTPDFDAASDETITEEELRGRRILVVDDSQMARAQTMRALDNMGAGYIVARDGKEALDILKEFAQEGDGVDQHVAMVISDIEMPEMDGYRLTSEIRTDPKLADLYVLLHTSLNGAINAEKAQTSGANDVLTKFVPEELTEKVSEGLKKAS